MKRSLSFLALALATLPGTPLAQSVWVVDDDGGPGVDFTVLQDAIDAAEDGDVLLLQAGRYDPRPAFPPAPTTVTGKGLVVVAEAGAAPVVGGILVEDLTSAQAFTLRGLSFDVPAVFEDCDGPVRVEDCTFQPPNFIGTTQPLDVVDCADVAFDRCTSIAGQQLIVTPSGLRASDSGITLYDCVLQGADGYGSSSLGGDGLELDGGFLFASGSTIEGGAGGCGGDGLHLFGASPQAITLGTSITAGAEGVCGGTLGEDVRVDAGTYSALPGTPRSFAATSPVRVGESTVLSYSGLPGDLVIGVYAPAADALYVPVFRGTLLVPATSFELEVLGAADGAGVLSTSVPILSVQGAATTLSLQAAGFQAGQGTTLSGGSSLLILAP